VPHVFEPAASGRAKCRGCGQPLPKGEIRFGEKLANPFAEGEMTHWFHPLCAAYKRPEAMLAALEAAPESPGAESLGKAAHATLSFARLARIDGAERAPGGQARCRHCKELIEKGGWRIRLVFHEEGTFSPGGFIHLACRKPYFEAGDVDIADQVLHFSPALDEASRAELKEALAS
jgi:hypothetical protein